MNRWAGRLGLVLVFMLGLVAGSGAGYLYGTGTANTQSEQRISDLQSQYDIVNANYLVLTREYNRLLTANNASPTSAAAIIVRATLPAATATKASSSAVGITPAVTPPLRTATPMPTSNSNKAAAPEAQFSSLSVMGPPGTEIYFKNESSGAITSWLWDFGDGTTSTEENPRHIYQGDPNKEFYSVKLTVTGPGGTDTILKEDYIQISESCGC